MNKDRTLKDYLSDDSERTEELHKTLVLSKIHVLKGKRIAKRLFIFFNGNTKLHFVELSALHIDTMGHLRYKEECIQ